MKATATQFSPSAPASASAGLGFWQLAWLAAAVFIVSAGYGSLMPLLPGWLASLSPGATPSMVARYAGFVTGIYAAGVLLGAPVWGLLSDRTGRGRVVIIGLVGYVASLVLLVPQWAGLWQIYALRGAAGFFVAAVVPVVSALVAEYTPDELRARRFAWLSAVSLVGFLFGPALSTLAEAIASGIGGVASALVAVQAALVLSAALGGVIMLGLALTLPRNRAARVDAAGRPATLTPPARPGALLWLNGVAVFVLAGFELGIVLQAQQAGGSTREAAIMFAACSLVMLAVNAALFVTAALEKVPPRVLIAAGLFLAVIGLGVMAVVRTDAWMYVGVGLTSAGTGLILPVIAYLAAGTSAGKLGATMGALAAAAGLGQTLGAAAAGWLFGAVAHRAFAVLALPLLAVLAVLAVLLLQSRKPAARATAPGATG